MSVKSLHVASKTEKVAWTVSESGDFVNQAKIPPRVSKASISWRLGQGKWLTLGDEMEDDPREQLGTAEANAGLISALFLTVLVPYLFEIDGLPWDVCKDNWSVDFCDVLHWLQSCIGIAAATCTFLGCLQAFLILAIMGELAGAVEPRRFVRMMGMQMSIGFMLFIFIMALTAIVIWIHMIAFTTIPGIGFACVGCTLAVFLVWSILAPVPYIQALYEIKHVCQTTPPLVLTGQQLEEIIQKFEADEETLTQIMLKETGDLPEGALKGFADKCKLREKFANKADREWTSLLLDETGTRRREGGLAPFLTPKLIHSFIERVYERQVELSAGTYKLVELYSERIMEKYAENEFKKTKFGQAFQLQVTD